MVRVLLADDEWLVRAGLRTVLELEDDLEVVGEAEDGEAAVREALRLSPDVVVMDVRMPGRDGIAATQELAAQGSSARVLVVTTLDTDEHVLRALRAGAAGFLVKATAPDRLVDAVRAVAAGDALLDPGATRRLVEHVRDAPATDPVLRERFDALSPRELEVLTAIARGQSNAEVAAALVVTEATVKAHVTHVLQKLGARSRVQAVVLAYEAGVLVPGRMS